MNSKSIFGSALFGLACFALAAGSDAAPTISVNVGKTTADVSPQMYGIFFEDINFGGDGGLYPELVENRSFEFDKALMGWKVAIPGPEAGEALPIRDETRPRNPRYLRVRVDQPGRFSLTNAGFRGMGLKEGSGYRFSIEARKHEGAISAIDIAILDKSGKTIGTGKVSGFKDDWASYECELTSSATDGKGSLKLSFEGTGSLDIDMVSLYPKDTFKGRANGLRPDLAQLLADMKPGFLRFPGGCIVEGFDLAKRYQWKNTIGPLDQRVSIIDRWNTEFAHRLTPDYYQSFGLGFYEYFQLCEDMGCEPMPILNCGMACEFNSAEVTPMDQLGPYVRDALDLIEFANGPADSMWGGIRAQMGHPEPFHLKLFGVGNEQWGPQYIERYKVFEKAIHEKYPDIKLIAGTGSDPTIFPNGEAEVKYLMGQWKELKPAFVDLHYYRDPEWFLQNADLFDNYDRSMPQVFVGEYAAQSVGVGKPENRNTWKCALYEAAFMTGMERNADVVRMTCYAPLFGNEDAWQWRPDLIWFNSLKSYGSANYYVQKLFSTNTGDKLLSVKTADAPSSGSAKQELLACATLDDKTGEAIIKVVNATGSAQETTIDLAGAAKLGATAKASILASKSLGDENTMEAPTKIAPKETEIPVAGAKFTMSFEPYSLTVLRVPVR